MESATPEWLVFFSGIPTQFLSPMTAIRRRRSASARSAASSFGSNFSIPDKMKVLGTWGEMWTIQKWVWEKRYRKMESLWWFCGGPSRSARTTGCMRLYGGGRGGKDADGGYRLIRSTFVGGPPPLIKKILARGDFLRRKCFKQTVSQTQTWTENELNALTIQGLIGAFKDASRLSKSQWFVN